MLKILTTIDDAMYFPILVILMASAGLIFSFTTRFVQVRKFKGSLQADCGKTGT